MPRLPDKPGTYRVRDKDGRYFLSGVRKNGQRIKIQTDTRAEAETVGRNLFGDSGSVAEGIGTIPQQAPQSAAVIDDWGIPIRVSPELAASVAQSFNLPSSTATSTPQVIADVKEEAEKKARRAKQAKSLMELAGVGYAAGVCMVSTKAVSRVSEAPAKPNPKQVNDLADCTKETFTEWFGDREIKPWQMMFLLTLGIPIAMWLQSPKNKVKQPEPKLKSVP